jgi:hypothetical protein
MKKIKGFQVVFLENDMRTDKNAEEVNEDNHELKIIRDRSWSDSKNLKKNYSRIWLEFKI